MCTDARPVRVDDKLFWKSATALSIRVLTLLWASRNAGLPAMKEAIVVMRFLMRATRDPRVQRTLDYTKAKGPRSCRGPRLLIVIYGDALLPSSRISSLRPFCSQLSSLHPS